MKPAVVILAAGKGKRMHSDRPKVLHRLADKPLVAHVVDKALTLKPEAIYMVYGHGGEQVRQALATLPIHWVQQTQQLGTGHAVAQAVPHIDDNTWVLVLLGDVPLIEAATLERLCQSVVPHSIGLLTVTLADAQGYGRIVRNAQGQVERIVEERDADTTIKNIKEINTGILIAQAHDLRRWLAALTTDNAQGEYYLTDIIERAVAEHFEIRTTMPNAVAEVMGVNDQRQLAELERYYQQQQVQRLLLNGVNVRDPARLDIRGQVQAGREVTIDVNVILEGQVTLGDRVSIGPYCLIRDAHIADDVQIFSHCVLESVSVAAHCRIGPFARLRPETQLAEHVHIGNFVEIKKSTVAQHSKINHLSYIGDATVGQAVNIGAGTITCNYDGVHKHQTSIGDRAFIGSDTQLVAPVTVGAGATIGAGSTITQDAPADTLTLSRVPQQTVPGWQPKKK